MRPLRWLTPRTRWFVTTRCLESRFFLKPTPALNQRFGFWLAKALARYPAIRLHAVYAASNHLHAVLTDTDGSLSAFCGYFLGMLARDVNLLHDRLGPVFHRRFSAEPILDDDAVAERIAYLVCNPVEDRLAAGWRHWPGTLLWSQSGAPQTHVFRRLDAVALRTAKAQSKHTGVPVREQDFVDRETLTIHPVDDDRGHCLDPDRIRTAVERRERSLAETLRGKPVLGPVKALRQDVNASPRHSDRSPRPLCHTSRREIWDEFRVAWRRLVSAYRETAARFRDGDLRVRFPAFTFPPWRPLVMPSIAR
jgi:hypothetical protein